MKMNKKLLVLSATFAAAAQFGTIAMADTVAGTVAAEVVTPLTITESTPMDFGTVAGGTTLGTIIMTDTGARSATGGAQFIGADGVAGVFTITGLADASITVSTPDTVATLVGTGADMGFVLASGTYPGTLTGGSIAVNFGGTLSIGASQTAGSYATVGNTFTVQVDYD